MPGTWLIEERVATAGVLHATWPAADDDPGVRRAAVCRPTGDALVLGSTQRPEVVDTGAVQAAGVEVVHRRSGGGAVLVTPDDPVWIDLWLPVGDPLWSHDVTGAFGWVGAAWGRALGRIGLDAVAVQGAGPGACTRWSSLVCFGGVGAGEVCVGGRKAVGLSQRRDRSGAWFHTACIRTWDPAPLLGLLVLSPGERAAAAVGLAGAVTGVGDEVAVRGGPVPSVGDVVGALLDSLP